MTAEPQGDMMFVRNLPRLTLSALATVLLGLAALVPSRAQALGLGDIHLNSTLDAPLSADIDVVDANADDLSTLKASIASRDTFTHFGADYPAFLGTLTFTTEHTADGRAVIHVSSSGVADEPFATLLVEADWARGHVVREYTVLLDPPVFNSKTPANTTVAAPQVDSGTRSGSIEPAPAAAATTAAAATASTAAAASGDGTPAAPAASEASGPNAASNPSAAAASPSESPPPAAATTHHRHAAANASGHASGSAKAPMAKSPAQDQGGKAGEGAGTAGESAGTGGAPGSAPGSSYTVHAGDTLSSIATQTYSPANAHARDQALVAIFRANPKAFAGKNMNVLRAGAVLALPGDDELTAVGPGEASTEVRAQYDAWRTLRGTANAGARAGNAEEGAGQLRLVAP